MHEYSTCNMKNIQACMYTYDCYSFFPLVSPEGSVLSSPSPVLVNQTNNITLTCTSMGGPDNMYQWFHGGILLPGGTTPTLTLNDVRASDEGDYMCRVSNVAGDGNSSSTVTGEL